MAVAVDASLATIEKAVAEGADLLIVHHGLFWQGVRMMTGGQYRKLKTAFDGGLAIYSSHIPLDIHPKWGNNALLAGNWALVVEDKFLSWKGIELGLAGDWEGTWTQLENTGSTKKWVLSSLRYVQTRQVGKVRDHHWRSWQRGGSCCRELESIPSSLVRGRTGVSHLPRNWGSLSFMRVIMPLKLSEFGKLEPFSKKNLGSKVSFFLLPTGL